MSLETSSTTPSLPPAPSTPPLTTSSSDSSSAATLATPSQLLESKFEPKQESEFIPVSSDPEQGHQPVTGLNLQESASDQAWESDARNPRNWPNRVKWKVPPSPFLPPPSSPLINNLTRTRSSSPLLAFSPPPVPLSSYPLRT